MWKRLERRCFTDPQAGMQYRPFRIVIMEVIAIHSLHCKSVKKCETGWHFQVHNRVCEYLVMIQIFEADSTKYCVYYCSTCEPVYSLYNTWHMRPFFTVYGLTWQPCTLQHPLPTTPPFNYHTSLLPCSLYTIIQYLLDHKLYDVK